MENIDWSALGFDYTKTDFNARFTFTDGKWSEMEITSDEYIKMHMSASCLHYGIELFEGLKVGSRRHLLNKPYQKYVSCINRLRITESMRSAPFQVALKSPFNKSFHTASHHLQLSGISR